MELCDMFEGLIKNSASSPTENKSKKSETDSPLNILDLFDPVLDLTNKS